MVLVLASTTPSMRDGLPDALVRKCEDGDAAAVAAWLDGGGSINMRQDFGSDAVAAGGFQAGENGRTLLMVAAACGHEHLVEMLIGRGATKSTQSYGEHSQPGNSALMAGAAKGHAPIVRRLLAAGAQKELRNGDGQTALQLAQAGGHAECVRLLADPSERRAAVRAAVRRRSVSQPQHVGFAAAANPLARWRRCLPCLK